MLVLDYKLDLSEFKETIAEYCTTRIDYLEGDECSIEESVEGFEEVDFLEDLRFFTKHGRLSSSKSKDLINRVIREAQVHAMEAKGQRATVHEIYQSLGIQKGDWNGATPVLKKIAAMEEEIAILKDEAGS